MKQKQADTKTHTLMRLRRIEGQVRGLQKMVEEERYCADVLVQISSVHEALRAVAREIMRNHLKQCATDAIRTGGARSFRPYPPCQCSSSLVRQRIIQRHQCLQRSVS